MPKYSLMRSRGLTLSRSPAESRLETAPRSRNCFLAIFVAVLLLGQPACLFRGKKKTSLPQAAPAAPARVVLLPMNLPTDNKDLRWVAMTAPILIAKTMETSADLEVVPLWQGMPIAVEALGQSREVTPEVAAYVASRLAARWTAVGELSSSKEGFSLLLDFVPVKATQVAYRYQKDARANALGSHFHEAVTQFLRYLAARPLGKPDSRLEDASSLKELAEVLDREYGWFVSAEPGKAESTVASLVKTDPKLARLLFNPGLYAGLGPAPSKPRPIELKPAAPIPAEKPSPVPPSPANPAKVQVPPAAPPPEIEFTQMTVILPPPRTFSQRIEPSAPLFNIRLDMPRRFASLPVETAVPARQPATPSTPIAPAARIAAASTDPAPTRSEGGSPSVRVAGGSIARVARPVKVQVCSSRNKEELSAWATRLAREGVTPEIETADLKDKGIWYRIRLQGYKSRQEAQAAAEKLRAAGLIKQYWLVTEN